MDMDKKIDIAAVAILDYFEEGKYSYELFKEENDGVSIPASHRQKKHIIKEFILKMYKSFDNGSKNEKKIMDAILDGVLKDSNHAAEKKKWKIKEKNMKKEIENNNKEQDQDIINMEKDYKLQIKTNEEVVELKRQLSNTQRLLRKKHMDSENLHERNLYLEETIKSNEMKHINDNLGVNMENAELKEKLNRKCNKKKKETKKDKEKRIRAEAKLKMEADIKSQLDAENDHESDDSYATSDDEIHE
jgi:hypothetical protein